VSTADDEADVLDPRALTEEVLEVGRRLDDVESALERVTDALDNAPAVAASPAASATGSWAWERLDQERSLRLWEELAGFVTWLDYRYAHHLSGDEHVIPSCWWKHPVAVEALTALMVARRAAYALPADEGAPGAAEASDALVEFHERSLWPTFARLRALKVFNGCARGHQDDARSRPVWEADKDEQFRAFLAGGATPSEEDADEETMT